MIISGRYSLDHTRLLNVKSNFAAQPEIDRLFPQVRLSSVSSSLVRDTRNDSIEPNTGNLIGADAELAARRIGSEVGFIKTFFQGFTYRQLGRPAAVASWPRSARRLGLATGFPRTVFQNGQAETIVIDDLPASERFFAGGDTTVRGFALDRLGTPETIDPEGFPKGGQGLVVLNAELRIPVRGVLGAVAFIDGGNVFRHVNDMDFSELRATVGFGVRYRSPVGPIRVDLGIKLDQARCCRQVSRNGRQRCISASGRRSDGIQKGQRDKLRHSVTHDAHGFGLSALCSSALSLHNAEIIDRVLAILPGQIITQSDVRAALDLGLVEPPEGSDRLAAGLSALIDRVLMLNEVRRVVPPEPSRQRSRRGSQRIRQRFDAPGALARALAESGIDEAVLSVHAADDLRLASYLDERFSASVSADR